MTSQDTICAVSTPPGMGAIAVIRISGPLSYPVISEIFKKADGKKVNLKDRPANSVIYGSIYDGDDILDEVVITMFKSPHSYTGEDTIEISCHGSVFIQQSILNLLSSKGIRPANRGEYTMRAFMNGKMDLSQAEAVADIISSHSAAARRVALQQMRGGFSKDIAELRAGLVSFMALIELELDFSEEDVLFADRSALIEHISILNSAITRLMESYRAGRVLKDGIPVVIAGRPNTGKSTLLNVLLNEEKAIVTDVAGTTRDIIEDTILINDMLFRIIDTAGLRKTDDPVESIGISRTYEKIDKASVLLYLIDVFSISENGISTVTKELDMLLEKNPLLSEGALLLIITKSDLFPPEILQNIVGEVRNTVSQYPVAIKTISVSAPAGYGIDKLKETLCNIAHKDISLADETIVTNTRHFAALQNASGSLARVREGLDSGISGDFLAQDIREVLHYLGSITGEIANDEVLGEVFGRFCIGK